MLYTAQPGDSLWRIASRVHGDAGAAAGALALGTPGYFRADWVADHVHPD